MNPQAASRPRRTHRKKSELNLAENGGIVSLSDAAMASDALASDQPLGDVPADYASAPAPNPGATPRRGRRAGSHAAGAKGPQAGELIKPLSGILGLLTLIIGLILCAGNIADPAVDFVTMDAAEANAIATPLANILSRQKWFRSYGRNLINSDDAIALVFATVVYAGRVAPVIGERMELRPARDRQRRAQQASGVSPQPTGPAGPGASNGTGPSGYTGLSGAYLADPVN